METKFYGELYCVLSKALKFYETNRVFIIVELVVKK